MFAPEEGVQVDVGGPPRWRPDRWRRAFWELVCAPLHNQAWKFHDKKHSLFMTRNTPFRC